MAYARYSDVEILNQSFVDTAKSLKTQDAYKTNDIDDSTANITYIGKEDEEGNWLIIKVDETSGVSITYATNSNNPTVTTYSNAWSNRTSLTYSTYSGAF